MNQHSFDLETALFPKQKPGTGLGMRPEHSSIMNSSAETLRRNLRDETRFALEYSNKYIYLSLFFSLAKIGATSYAFISQGPFCMGCWQIWLITMLVYDVYNSVLTIIRLRNIKELNDELVPVSKIPIMGDNNFTMTMAFNPGENLLDQVNNHTHSRRHIEPKIQGNHPLAYHEEKINSKAVAILRRRRIIANFSKAAQVYYFLVLLGGQVLYFVNRADVCTTALINTMIYVYLGLAYLWFFGPALLLVMSALFLPVVLIFLCLFGKSNQRPAKKIDIKKLPVVPYSLDLQGDIECAICVLEYHEGENVVQLPCNPKHYFHEHCLARWLKLNGQCPVCRVRIDERMNKEHNHDADGQVKSERTPSELSRKGEL